MKHTAIRNAASIYYLCPMVKYRITGADAAAYLNRLTVRNAATLPVGSVHCTVWCDDADKVLDDGKLVRHWHEDYLLCCQERHLPWLLDRAIGCDVHLREVSDDTAALSLQGLCAATVLANAGFDVSTLKPFRMALFALVILNRPFPALDLRAIWAMNCGPRRTTHLPYGRRLCRRGLVAEFAR